MKTEFKKNLDFIIKRVYQNQTPKKIAVALSGGGDSIALTLLLNNYLKQYAPKTKLYTITVDHGLRTESKKEAKLVGSMMKKLKITHKILTYKGKIPSKNIEAMARDYRYEMLFDFCKKK